MAEHKDESLLTKCSGVLLDNIVDFVGRKIKMPLLVRHMKMEYKVTIDGDMFHITSYKVKYVDNVILDGQVIRATYPVLLTDMYLRGSNHNVVAFLCGALGIEIGTAGVDEFNDREELEQIVLEYDKAYRVVVELDNFEEDLSFFLEDKIRPVLVHMMSVLGNVLTSKKRKLVASPVAQVD